jgi:hypothetical protein
MSQPEKSGTSQTAAAKSEHFADEIIKNLRWEAKALREVGQRVKGKGRPNYRPLIIAGLEILRAACEGLLDAILNLAKIAPEARLLMQDYCRNRPHLKEQLATIEAAGPASPPRIAGAATSEATHAMFWVWHTKAEAKALARDPAGFEIGTDISKVLQTLPIKDWSSLGFFWNGEGSPQDPCFIGNSIVKRCWRYLRKKYRDDMPQEAAYLALTKSPLPEVWDGGEEDFIKGALVCEFLADKIEERSDAITVSHAMKQYSIKVKSTLTRACKRELDGKPLIRKYGESGQELLISRHDLEKNWLPSYRAGEAKRKHAEQTQIRYSYECSNPSCDKTWTKVLEKPPHKCPECSGETRPIPGKAQGSRTQRRRN